VNPAAVAIANLYALTGSEFDRRLMVMATNIKGRLLEEVVRTPGGLHTDIEDLLGDLSAAIIETQKTACEAAKISDEQKQNFEDHVDNVVAEAIIIIRDAIDKHKSRTSVAFQMEAAQRLGVPVQ
jgi:hypothetical protein